MINEKITANIGFEKKIWDAACVLRGNMDASEYKSVVLGLIFLKYINGVRNLFPIRLPPSPSRHSIRFPDKDRVL